MKSNTLKILYIIFYCVVISGCRVEPQNVSETIIDKPILEEQVSSQIVFKDIMYEVSDLITMGNSFVFKTGRENPVFVCYDIMTLDKQKEFGILGRGRGEWIKPHLVENTYGGYDIFDNGNSRIYRYQNDSLIGEFDYLYKSAVNNLRRINNRFSGYTYIEPNKIALVIYDGKKYDIKDEFYIEDYEKKGNAINWDFVWDGNKSHLIIGHLYKKEFYVLEIDSKGKIIHNVRYIGKYTFSPNQHVYYSDARIFNEKIYLLNQQDVDPNTGDGVSIIDVFDLFGKYLEKIKLDVVVQKMFVKEDSILLWDIDGNLRIIKCDFHANN